MLTHKCQVSVVIAHNPNRKDNTLEACTDAIWEQGVQDIHVITEGNKSESRNIGVAESSGEILMFFDDDCKPRRHCIDELLEPFDDPKVGVVGGVNIALPNMGMRESIGGSLLASPLAMMRSSSRYTPRGDVRESDESEVLSCVMAVRREAFNKAGGFPSDIIPCEENVLINNIQKLGYKIIYNPFAVVYHNRRAIFLPYWKEVFNYGKGRGIMMRERKGNPKMLWMPNKRWLYYIVAMVGHYVSYILGVIWGYANGKRCYEKGHNRKSVQP